MDINFKMTDTSLVTSNRYDSSPEVLFKAWTDPEIMKKWFAPSDAMTIPLVEVDLQVGGRYTIHMRSPDGQDHIVKGEYQSITPNQELVFSWQWTTSENPPSRVTVKFIPDGTGTVVDFTHDTLPNAEAVQSHSEGWTGCLGRLSTQ